MTSVSNFSQSKLSGLFLNNSPNSFDFIFIGLFSGSHFKEFVNSFILLIFSSNFFLSPLYFISSSPYFVFSSLYFVFSSLSIYFSDFLLISFIKFHSHTQKDNNSFKNLIFNQVSLIFFKVLSISLLILFIHSSENPFSIKLSVKSSLNLSICSSVCISLILLLEFSGLKVS
ncbi:MAG: hypothetical protein LBQ24_04025 [Candidatus Peribacteria bacterium]|nr:hypothetical protein [Candidatus Peribacteria bacterium]